MKQSFLFVCLFDCFPPTRAAALLWTVDVERDEYLRDGKLAGTTSSSEFPLHVAVGTQTSMHAACELH